MRLLLRRSRLTDTGRLPRDAGIPPEKWLKERLRVPAREVRSERVSGREPLRELSDKSTWRRNLRERSSVGREPEREL